MHSLQTASTFYLETLKLEVHFGKIHVKLLNQFCKGGKKPLQSFKDHYISAADRMKTKIHTCPLFSIHWEGPCFRILGVSFHQMQQQNLQAYQAQVAPYPIELSVSALVWQLLQPHVATKHLKLG